MDFLKQCSIVGVAITFNECVCVCVSASVEAPNISLILSWSVLKSIDTFAFLVLPYGSIFVLASVKLRLTANLHFLKGLNLNQQHCHLM